MKKLVRDKIPELYDLKVYVADDDEFWKRLLEKLQEEVDEFKSSEEKEELVDVLEVVYAISESKGVSIEELEELRKSKLEKKGGFKKKFIWEKK